MTGSRWLFGSAVFLSAFLLFLVEPICGEAAFAGVGRLGSGVDYVPRLLSNGAAACAYSYAHWVSFRPRWNLYFALLFPRVRVGYGTVHANRQARGRWVRASDLDPLWRLGQHYRIAFPGAGNDEPADAGLVGASAWSAIPYRLFALIERGLFTGAGALSNGDRTAVTLQAQRVAWSCGFAVFALISAVLARKTAAVAQQYDSLNSKVVEMRISHGVTSSEALWGCFRWGQRCS